MAERAPCYGLLGEFGSPDALLEAAKRMRSFGYVQLEAYSPYPVEGLEEILGFHDARVRWLGLIGGLCGAVFAFAMQLYTNYDWPIDVGGRPIYAVPAFLVVVFELTILFAVLVPVFGMLALNGLPRLHHPIFGARRFALATEDRFFLCLRGDDPRFDPGAVEDRLREIGARHVEIVAP
ncbi:MAG: DUF3341 domain-containing protein [Alphaproteobacteria bacterium]|nr:DUF3341 domain-containing protein [Alphaproteobacteria bacterium]